MLRIAHIPTGRIFSRGSFLGVSGFGTISSPASPQQKAKDLLALVENLPDKGNFQEQVEKCMAPLEEAEALRKYSGGWGKLNDMMAPEEAMACLEAFESRITSQPGAALGQTAAPEAPVKRCPLGVLAAVGVVGLAAAALISLHKG